MAGTFAVGTRVDGLYDGGDVWFPGVVDGINGSTFSIQYDDGEREDAVPESLLRLHVQGTFSVGSRVLARYNGGDDFYGGVIADIDCDAQTYAISYDDGEYQGAVPFAFIVDESAPAEVEADVTASTDDEPINANNPEPLESDAPTPRDELSESRESASPSIAPAAVDRESDSAEISGDNADSTAEASTRTGTNDTIAVDSAAHETPVESSPSTIDSPADGTEHASTVPDKGPEDAPKVASRPSSTRHIDRDVDVRLTPVGSQSAPGSRSTSSASLKLSLDPPVVDSSTCAQPEPTHPSFRDVPVVTLPLAVATSPAMIITPPPRDREPVQQPPTKPPRATRPKSADTDGQPSAAVGFADEAFSSVLTHQQEIQSILKTIGESVVDNDSMVVVKNALAQLLQQLRIAPHVTVDCCREQHGESVLVQCVHANAGYSILVCFVFVIVRRMCSVSEAAFVKFIELAVLDAVASVMTRFPHDAVLQASACGVLATFAQSTGIELMLECQVAKLIVQVLHEHQSLNHYSRQVHFYACEVLAKLCDGGDPRVLRLMTAPHPAYHSPVHLFVFLLRQGHQHEDQKVACAACTLVLCLAARDRESADILRSIGALADVSTVMAKFPNDNGIASYSQSATREIALSSMKYGTTTKVQETAKGILRKEDLRLGGDLFEPAKPQKPKQSRTKSSQGSTRKQQKLQLKQPPNGGGDFTPSKTTLFSRNTMSPAPQLTHNVADSLTKIQQYSLKKPSTALEYSTGSAMLSSVKKPPLLWSTDEFPPTKHTFTPFEEKLEKRLIQASHSKIISAPSPKVSTKDREDILLRTYGVPKMRNIDRLRGLPTSSVVAAEATSASTARPPKHSTIESSSSSSNLHSARGVSSATSVHEKSLTARPPSIPGKAAKSQGHGVAPRPPSKPGNCTPKKAPSTPSKSVQTPPPRATTPIKVVKQNLSKASVVQQPVPPSDLTQLATQLFHPVDDTLADVEHVPVVETRLSFSDKLHEMIKKAEVALCRQPSASNLASGDDAVKFDASQLPAKPPKASKKHQASSSPSPIVPPPTSEKKLPKQTKLKTTHKPPVAPVKSTTEKKSPKAAQQSPVLPVLAPSEVAIPSIDIIVELPRIIESDKTPRFITKSAEVETSAPSEAKAEELAAAQAPVLEEVPPAPTDGLDKAPPAEEQPRTPTTNVADSSDEAISRAEVVEEPPNQPQDSARSDQGQQSSGNLSAAAKSNAEQVERHMSSEESGNANPLGAEGLSKQEDDSLDRPSTAPVEASYDDDDFEKMEDNDEEEPAETAEAAQEMPSSVVDILALDDEKASMVESPSPQESSRSMPDDRSADAHTEESMAVAGAGTARSSDTTAAVESNEVPDDATTGDVRRVGDLTLEPDAASGDEPKDDDGSTAQAQTARQSPPSYELPSDDLPSSDSTDTQDAPDTPDAAISPCDSGHELLVNSPTEANEDALETQPSAIEDPNTLLAMSINVAQRYDAEEFDTTTSTPDELDSPAAPSETRDVGDQAASDSSNESPEVPSKHQTEDTPADLPPDGETLDTSMPSADRDDGQLHAVAQGATSGVDPLGSTEEIAVTQSDDSDTAVANDESSEDQLPPVSSSSLAQEPATQRGESPNDVLDAIPKLDVEGDEIPTPSKSESLADTEEVAAEDIVADEGSGSTSQADTVLPALVASPRVKEEDTTGNDVVNVQNDASSGDVAEVNGGDVQALDQDNPGDAKSDRDDNAPAASTRLEIISSRSSETVEVDESSINPTADSEPTSPGLDENEQSAPDSPRLVLGEETPVVVHPVPPVSDWNVALLRAAEESGACEDEEFDHHDASDRSTSRAEAPTDRSENGTTVDGAALSSAATTPTSPSGGSEVAQTAEDVSVVSLAADTSDAPPTHPTQAISEKADHDDLIEANTSATLKDGEQPEPECVLANDVATLQQDRADSERSPLVEAEQEQTTASTPPISPRDTEQVAMAQQDIEDFPAQVDEPSTLPAAARSEVTALAFQPIEQESLPSNEDNAEATTEDTEPEATGVAQASSGDDLCEAVKPLETQVGSGDAASIDIDHTGSNRSDSPPAEAAEPIETPTTALASNEDDSSSHIFPRTDEELSNIAPTDDKPLDDPYGDDFEGHDDDQEDVSLLHSATTEAMSEAPTVEIAPSGTPLDEPKPSDQETLEAAPIDLAEEVSSTSPLDLDTDGHEDTVETSDIMQEPPLSTVDASVDAAAEAALSASDASVTVVVEPFIEAEVCDNEVGVPSDGANTSDFAAGSPEDIGKTNGVHTQPAVNQDVLQKQEITQASDEGLSVEHPTSDRRSNNPDDVATPSSARDDPATNDVDGQADEQAIVKIASSFDAVERSSAVDYTDKPRTANPSEVALTPTVVEMPDTVPPPRDTEDSVEQELVDDPYAEDFEGLDIEPSSPETAVDPPSVESPPEHASREIAEPAEADASNELVASSKGVDDNAATPRREVSDTYGLDDKEVANSAADASSPSDEVDASIERPIQDENGINGSTADGIESEPATSAAPTQVALGVDTADSPTSPADAIQEATPSAVEAAIKFPSGDEPAVEASTLPVDEPAEVAPILLEHRALIQADQPSPAGSAFYSDNGFTNPSAPSTFRERDRAELDDQTKSPRYDTTPVILNDEADSATSANDAPPPDTSAETDTEGALSPAESTQYSDNGFATSTPPTARDAIEAGPDIAPPVLQLHDEPSPRPVEDAPSPVSDIPVAVTSPTETATYSDDGGFVKSAPTTGRPPESPRADSQPSMSRIGNDQLLDDEPSPWPVEVVPSLVSDNPVAATSPSDSATYSEDGEFVKSAPTTGRPPATPRADSHPCTSRTSNDQLTDVNVDHIDQSASVKYDEHSTKPDTSRSADERTPSARTNGTSADVSPRSASGPDPTTARSDVDPPSTEGQSGADGKGESSPVVAAAQTSTPRNAGDAREHPTTKAQADADEEASADEDAAGHGDEDIYGDDDFED